MSIFQKKETYLVNAEIVVKSASRNTNTYTIFRVWGGITPRDQKRSVTQTVNVRKEYEPGGTDYGRNLLVH